MNRPPVLTAYNHPMRGVLADYDDERLADYANHAAESMNFILVEVCRQLLAERRHALAA